MIRLINKMITAIPIMIRVGVKKKSSIVSYYNETNENIIGVEYGQLISIVTIV